MTGSAASLISDAEARDNVPSALGILAALRPLRFIRLSFAFSKMKRV